MDNSDEESSRIRAQITPASAQITPDSKRFRVDRIVGGSLPGADGRSGWPRLMRDTFQRLLVHCGGDDTVSETQRMMARRIATLEAELVHMEDKLATIRAAGGEPDPAMLALYGTLADRQRRLADPLGWQRTQRDVTADAQHQKTEWVIVQPPPWADEPATEAPDAAEDAGGTDEPAGDEPASAAS
jgi:hypothetical protein